MRGDMSAEDGEVLRYNAATNSFVDKFVEEDASGDLADPTDLAFGPDGDLRVSSAETSEVKRYDGATGTFEGNFVSAGLGGLNEAEGVAFGDNGNLFVVSELIATVVSLAVDPTTGALTERDAFRVPSLDGGVVQSAGILLAPDNRHLFVSLRGCDEILVLRIGADGKLIQTARVPSGGKTPRDLCFSPSGKHLVVANQDSDRLTVFAVDHAAGTLSAPLQHFDVGTPMSVKLAAF